MTDTDQFFEWDAAYVLGALSAGDRADYEEHLAGCGRCRSSVAELAGLPGLLGQLSPGEAIAVESDGSAPGAHPWPGEPVSEPFAVPEPPDSLMPRLPRSAEARQRWLAPLAAAAAVLLIGGVGGYAVSALRNATPGQDPASTAGLVRSRLAFAPVKASPMTAVVDLVPTGEGTDVRVECQYAPGAAGAAGATASPTTPSPSRGMGSSGATGSSRSMGSSGSMGHSGATGSPAATTSPGATGSWGSTDSVGGTGGYTGVHYAIWVVGRDGREMQVKDWTARSGRIMHPSGVTPWAAAKIAAVEIRLVDTNDAVLRARLG